MATSSTDRIEKRIELRAPVARVWRALTHHEEFGQWFGVKIEQPFAPGARTRGHITHPGYEHLTMEVTVQAMENERRFSFHWHPYAVDPKIDYSKEPPTLVEFVLEKTPTGTVLLVTESGFDAIPLARRAEAFRMNEGGWTQQVKNIEAHVRSAA
ncbi:MAG: SRPBCC family protein [Hyalangium sp.]|uniref:SRPBCC family protein n=1 Tax=Hyalangium sp. TaxID=2028555 RepID=UPI00389B0962